MQVSSQVDKHPAHRWYAWQGASEAGVSAVHLLPSVRCRPHGLPIAGNHYLAVECLVRSHLPLTFSPPTYGITLSYSFPSRFSLP